MRIFVTLAIAIIVMSTSAVAEIGMKSCSANRAYCAAEAKKRGWTRPQCAEAFDRCMRSGEWQTTGEFGRSLRNVERR